MEVGYLISDMLMDSPQMAAMVVDREGLVVFINKTYLQILELTEEEILGKHVGLFTPETRTLTVLNTGKAVVGYNWRVKGHDMIACSLPLINDNGELIGCFAYSLFLDIWDAKSMVENLVFELNMYKEAVQSFYSTKYTFGDIIGESQGIQRVKQMAQQFALHSYTTVLITGESGVGKELFAQAIHNRSSRSRLPFVRVNCAAIPENLLEAELFGYEEGAYTGAKKGGKPGKFELANGGTVFLDEIGEMSFSMQSKLLVVLQEKEIERLGGSRPIKVNVRIIAATNRSLEHLVERGLFREDLYYRLNVVHLEIPPLRKRGRDINLIIRHLIPRLNQRLQTVVRDMSAEACQLMLEYHWPGNVRELENVLERAMILADMDGSSTITTRHLVFYNEKLSSKFSTTSGSLKTNTEEFEKQFLIKVLEENGYDRAKTARVLDIDPSSLYKKVKKYGISLKNS